MKVPSRVVLYMPSALLGKGKCISLPRFHVNAFRISHSSPLDILIVNESQFLDVERTKSGWVKIFLHHIMKE